MNNKHVQLNNINKSKYLIILLREYKHKRIDVLKSCFEYLDAIQLPDVNMSYRRKTIIILKRKQNHYFSSTTILLTNLVIIIDGIYPMKNKTIYHIRS